MKKIPRVWEGGSQGSRCTGLENNQFRCEQTFRELQERDFQEDKMNRTFDDLKLSGGFTFIVKNLRKLNKHTKRKMITNWGKTENKMFYKKKRHF